MNFSTNITLPDLKYLVDGSLITKEALKYFFDKMDDSISIENFYMNTPILEYFLKNDIINIKDLIDKCSEIRPLSGGSSYLHLLLDSRARSFDVIRKDLMSIETFEYLLNKFKLHDDKTLFNLLHSEILLKFCLGNFLIDDSLIEKFDKILKSYPGNDSFFESLQKIYRNNKNFHNLLDTYELVCSFNTLTVEERKKIFETAQNSEKSKNILKQLLDNHLETQYSFEQLKNLSIKDNNKRKIKMNF